jgi:hypothetical protein
LFDLKSLKVLVVALSAKEFSNRLIDKGSQTHQLPGPKMLLFISNLKKDTLLMPRGFLCNSSEMKRIASTRVPET